MRGKSRPVDHKSDIVNIISVLLKEKVSVPVDIVEKAGICRKRVKLQKQLLIRLIPGGRNAEQLYTVCLIVGRLKRHQPIFIQMSELRLDLVKIINDDIRFAVVIAYAFVGIKIRTS